MTSSKKYLVKKSLFRLYRNKNLKEKYSSRMVKRNRRKSSTLKQLSLIKMIVRNQLMTFRRESYISFLTRSMKIENIFMRN